MIDDLPKLSLMEKRLTALEREVRELRQKHYMYDLAPIPEKLQIRCDEPGLLATQAYEVEKFDDGSRACWLGSAGAIQLKLPVAPARPFLCKLNIAPFHSVDLDELQLHVNDAPVDHAIEILSQNLHRISFYGEARDQSFINIMFSGINSIRPVDIGESQDVRLLAFQFFGAEIEFISATEE